MNVVLAQYLSMYREPKTLTLHACIKLSQLINVSRFGHSCYSREGIAQNHFNLACRDRTHSLELSAFWDYSRICLG